MQGARLAESPAWFSDPEGEISLSYMNKRIGGFFFSPQVHTYMQNLIIDIWNKMAAEISQFYSCTFYQKIIDKFVKSGFQWYIQNVCTANSLRDAFNTVDLKILMFKINADCVTSD